MCTSTQLKIRLAQIESKINTDKYSTISKLHSFRMNCFKIRKVLKKHITKHPDRSDVLTKVEQMCWDNFTLCKNRYFRMKYELIKYSNNEFAKRKNDYIQQTKRLRDDIDDDIISIVDLINNVEKKYK